MAQDNVGKHAQSTPPSFIPAGSRRRTTPAVTPAAQSSGSPVPPSFTPPSRRHSEPTPTTSSTSRSSTNRAASTNRSSTGHSTTAGRTTGHSTNRSTSSSSGPRVRHNPPRRKASRRLQPVPAHHAAPPRHAACNQPHNPHTVLPCHHETPHQQPPSDQRTPQAPPHGANGAVPSTSRP